MPEVLHVCLSAQKCRKHSDFARIIRALEAGIKNVMLEGGKMGPVRGFLGGVLRKLTDSPAAGS
jgi:hypothetical protein